MAPKTLNLMLSSAVCGGSELWGPCNLGVILSGPPSQGAGSPRLPWHGGTVLPDGRTSMA